MHWPWALPYPAYPAFNALSVVPSLTVVASYPHFLLFIFVILPTFGTLILIDFVHFFHLRLLLCSLGFLHRSLRLLRWSSHVNIIFGDGESTFNDISYI